MKAFTNTPITKEKFIQHLKKHQEMDAFEKGHYGQGFEMGDEKFKGCAVGCSLRSVALELGIEISTKDHSLYEKYLGIPRWLAHVEDKVFEDLPLEKSKNWPLEFAKAVKVGADLDKVKVPFLIFVLESCLEYVQGENHHKQKEVIKEVINLYKRKDKVGAREWEKAVVVAYAAGYTGSAGYTTAYAAEVAGYTTDYTAETAAYEKFAEKLLELMRECE